MQILFPITAVLFSAAIAHEDNEGLLVINIGYGDKPEWQDEKAHTLYVKPMPKIGLETEYHVFVPDGVASPPAGKACLEYENFPKERFVAFTEYDVDTCSIEEQLKMAQNAGAEALFVICPPAPKSDSTKSADNSQKSKSSGNTDASKTEASSKSADSSKISDGDQKTETKKAGSGDPSDSRHDQCFETEGVFTMGPVNFQTIKDVISKKVDGKPVIAKLMFQTKFQQFFANGTWTYIPLFAFAVIVLSAILAGRGVQPVIQNTLANPMIEGSGRGDGKKHKTKKLKMEEPEEDFAMLDWKMAVGFVVVGSVWLVVLFFLKKYFYWIVVVSFLFVAGAAWTLGLSTCIRAVSKKMTTSWVPEIIGLVPAVALCVTWFCLRSNMDRWWSQDLLGIATVCQMHQMIRVPNMKITAFFLTIMIFFDIFWVFLSPKFFGGKSVMVEVAAGDENHQLPMVFLFPNGHMLGLGDLALPGLLVTYTRRFDLLSGIPIYKGYFLVCSLSYLFGMVATMFGLAWMDSPQPALIYLCPAILVGTLVVAAIRGDFKTMLQQEHRFVEGCDATPAKDAKAHLEMNEANAA